MLSAEAPCPLFLYTINMNDINPKDQIIKITKDALAALMPELKAEGLEENGKVYYMNGRDGTFFDWTMNGHACPFMCFYNDKNAMGAIKVTAYNDGDISICVYHNGENSPFKEESAKMDPEDILKLVVFLEKTADNESYFDKSLDDLEYIEPSAEEIADFQKSCEETEA